MPKSYIINMSATQNTNGANNMAKLTDMIESALADGLDPSSYRKGYARLCSVSVEAVDKEIARVGGEPAKVSQREIADRHQTDYPSEY